MARSELGFELDANSYRKMSQAINAHLQQEIEDQLSVLKNVCEFMSTDERALWSGLAMSGLC
jgi:hypothetical protein